MMDWSQLLTIVGSNLALFIWARTEASQDRRELYSIVNADRKDMLSLVRSIEQEIRDFHHRLINIEKGRNNVPKNRP